MMTINRCATIDHIEGLHDTENPGAFRLVFMDRSCITVKNINIKTFAAYFDCEDGKGNLQEKIHGQRIIYCMNFWQELKGFTPAEKWDGVEMSDGNFLIDRCSY